MRNLIAIKIKSKLSFSRLTDLTFYKQSLQWGSEWIWITETNMHNFPTKLLLISICWKKI